MSRFATRLFDLFFTPRMPEPYAGLTQRWLVWLLFCVVMLVFPGLGFLSALLVLVDVVGGRPIDPIGEYSGLAVVANIAFTAVPIAMVWGFLRLSGDRLMRIGLVGKPVRETAREGWWTFVWIFLVCGLIQVMLSLLIGLVPFAHHVIADVQIGTGVSFADLAFTGIPAAICAGLLEEIVVLGFAYRMLERLRLSDRSILILLVALRLSYHLYYGLTAISLLPWAYLSVIYYRRYRRIWPLIIGHAAWDTYAILTSASPLAEFIGLAIMVLLTVLALVVAIIRWLRVRRGTLLTLEIPRPRPAWKRSPADPGYRPQVQRLGG